MPNSFVENMVWCVCEEGEEFRMEDVLFVLALASGQLRSANLVVRPSPGTKKILHVVAICLFRHNINFFFLLYLCTLGIL